MHARWLSFVVWALLAASLAYWSLVLMAKGPAAPAQSRAAMSDAAPADWTRLFAAGQPAAPVEATSSRYQLLGVVAPSAGDRHPGEGVALIAVAGALPRPVRIGQVVDGDLKLIEISRREAGLGTDGTVTIRLTVASSAAGGDAMPGQPPQVVPSAYVAPPPPNFNNGQAGPGRGFGPGAEGMVIPTAINPQLPVQQPGDGSANPLK
ncbi:hypothetical protein CDN99_25740 [Roseateles aquatilis]|uniref:Type II secretion system protein GspC N-terminal domain-containing protein n=1 Tax=Roseateles aquatilis TaxID=431061 RepID=A0A246IUW3_9BURK|nr:hypothetical protein [Roseateles aquatilis]OWQ83539.1 hypothetical protein CDN99_25740 [Roseateles aquatilis]